MKKILTPTNYELIPLNDKTNVRFFTSIDPGSYVAPHWHDAVEIVYLLEGELKVIVGNDSRNLKAGQCAMVTPNQIHSTLCTSPNRAIVFQIPEAFMEKFIPHARNLCFSLQDPAASPVLQSKVELFKETLIKMQFLTDLQPDGAVLRFNSLLFETLFVSRFRKHDKRFCISWNNCLNMDSISIQFPFTAYDSMHRGQGTFCTLNSFIWLRSNDRLLIPRLFHIDSTDRAIHPASDGTVCIVVEGIHLC